MDYQAVGLRGTKDEALAAYAVFRAPDGLVTRGVFNVFPFRLSHHSLLIRLSGGLGKASELPVQPPGNFFLILHFFLAVNRLPYQLATQPADWLRRE